MTKHLFKEVDYLKRQLLELSAMVEDRVYRAVKAVRERDGKLASEVVVSDIEIDRKEVAVEEECLKLLALHQPVAMDLRFIVSVLKMNNDLERIADLAVNIADRALSLSKLSPADCPFDFEGMAEKVRRMLHNVLESLVNLDATLAQQVLRADDEVDAINREMYRRISEKIRAHPSDIEQLLYFLSVSRSLERIADHATNIAEDVIYMVEGEIVRHSKFG